MDLPTPTKPIKRQRGTPNIDRTISSPCISLCLLDETDTFCIGCNRTVDELRDWCIMDAEQKIKVLEDIEGRKSKT
ncbi:hypothetical protein LCGC14_2494970 [marine sediment metagenome]|uniref:DUF1289 domain-containing protein n=1 Tax=marine sediment metagenome TaxID=412755 RepID=A0A0F9DFD3_9ZZZZ